MVMKLGQPVDPELSSRLESSILGDTPLEFGDSGSSLVDSASYDPDQRMLWVTLKSGSISKTYRYAGYPPSEWVDFYQANSKGGFFTKRIRSLYAGVLDA